MRSRSKSRERLVLQLVTFSFSLTLTFVSPYRFVGRLLLARKDRSQHYRNKTSLSLSFSPTPMSFSYLNSPDINVASGSSIMGLESPNIPSDSSYSRQDDDMYLSDLGPTDQTAIMQKPFSLLARVDPGVSTPVRKEARSVQEDDYEHQGEEEDQAACGQVTTEERRAQVAKQQEEKLQSDIFILKKLNASFELFNEALQDTGSANEVRDFRTSSSVFIFILPVF